MRRVLLSTTPGLAGLLPPAATIASAAGAGVAGRGAGCRFALLHLVASYCGLWRLVAPNKSVLCLVLPYFASLRLIASCCA